MLLCNLSTGLDTRRRFFASLYTMIYMMNTVMCVYLYIHDVITACWNVRRISSFACKLCSSAGGQSDAHLGTIHVVDATHPRRLFRI